MKHNFIYFVVKMLISQRYQINYSNTKRFVVVAVLLVSIILLIRICSSMVAENFKGRRIKKAIDRKVILIIGQGRSGSSLIGDLFNQRDDSLYFYEPLRAIEHYLKVVHFRLKNVNDIVKYTEVTDNFLLHLMTCNYDEEDDQILNYLDQGQFRYHSKMLTSPPFCVNQTCRILNSKLMNEFCFSHPNINMVVKDLEFRIPNMDLVRLFKLYAEVYKLKVYVIHLVRDPRAYLLSMKKLEWFSKNHPDTEKQVETYIRKRCQETLDNMSNIKKLKEQLKIKYKILKFEDFVGDTKTVGKALGEFLEMDLKRTLEEFSKKKFSKEQKMVKDPFSTDSRETLSIINGWRKETNLHFIQKVQRYCHELMDNLGYSIITGDEIIDSL